MPRPEYSLLFILTLITHGVGDAEDWFRYRGPQLSGVSAESEWNTDWPETGPKTAWTASVGTGLSSVSVSEGRVYTMGNEENVDTVYCLDAHSGEAIWTHSYVSPTDANEFEGGPTSTPTVDGDRLYTLARQGDLFCFDKVSGQVIWSINAADKADVRIPGWGFSGSPLIIGNLLIVNVGDAGAAFEKTTGELVWKSEDKDSGYASPTPFPHSEPTGVILGSARSYVCVDLKSGKELWRQKWLTTFGCNAADPIVDGNRVFLSSGYNRGCGLFSILPGGPELLWKNREMQNQISSSVAIEGHVYGVHGDVEAGAKLRCIELATGNVKWTCDEFRAGSLIAAGGTVGNGYRLIVISDDGELIVGSASSSDFVIAARHQVLNAKCWTAPVLSSGHLFCRSIDGTLVCLDVQ